MFIPTNKQGCPECVATKEREMDAFKKFNVYQEVENEGQERLSSHWVMTDKATPEDNKKNVKVRLLCRGFEETIKVQADSLTGSKETLKILFAIAASNDWTIKNAYLQGEEIDRLIYMEPPPELKKPGKLRKLK